MARPACCKYFLVSQETLAMTLAFFFIGAFVATGLRGLKDFVPLMLGKGELAPKDPPDTTYKWGALAFVIVMFCIKAPAIYRLLSVAELDRIRKLNPSECYFWCFILPRRAAALSVLVLIVRVVEKKFEHEYLALLFCSAATCSACLACLLAGSTTMYVVCNWESSFAAWRKRQDAMAGAAGGGGGGGDTGQLIAPSSMSNDEKDVEMAPGRSVHPAAST